MLLYMMLLACDDSPDSGEPPNGLDVRLTEVEANVAELFATTDAAVADVAEHERRLDDHDGDLTEIAATLNNHENRLVKLEAKNEAHDLIEAGLAAEIEALEARVATLEAVCLPESP